MYIIYRDFNRQKKNLYGDDKCLIRDQSWIWNICINGQQHLKKTIFFCIITELALQSPCIITWEFKNHCWYSLLSRFVKGSCILYEKCCCCCQSLKILLKFIWKYIYGSFWYYYVNYMQTRTKETVNRGFKTLTSKFISWFEVSRICLKIDNILGTFDPFILSVLWKSVGMFLKIIFNRFVICRYSGPHAFFSDSIDPDLDISRKKQMLS